MKKTLFFPLLFLAATLLPSSGCEKPAFETSAPSCIRDKIRDLQNKPVQNPPAEVWKWKSGGQTYFYFTSDCCDFYNWLYTEDCEQLCAPDGGFSGRGTEDCPDFGNNVEEILVWKDDRE